jgi:hypothetical protein
MSKFINSSSDTTFRIRREQHILDRYKEVCQVEAIIRSKGFNPNNVTAGDADRLLAGEDILVRPVKISRQAKPKPEPKPKIGGQQSPGCKSTGLYGVHVRKDKSGIKYVAEFSRKGVHWWGGTFKNLDDAVEKAKKLYRFILDFEKSAKKKTEFTPSRKRFLLLSGTD